MSRSTCPWVLRRLALFAGGDHRPADDARIRGHLADCPSCRLELGPYLRARRALAGAAAEQPARLDLGAMHREVMEAVAGLPVPSSAPRRGLRAGLLAAGLFCIGLVAVQWAARGSGLLDREPIPMPPGKGAAMQPEFGYGLRPLGSASGPVVGSPGALGSQGLMGRLELSTLELEYVLPELGEELRRQLEELEDPGQLEVGSPNENRK